MTPDEPLGAPPSFLAYTPVALAFGTSGLRGLVKDITDLEAYVNVKAALRYMLASRDIAAGSTVVIAGDLRPSTDRILVATVQAVLDAGTAIGNFAEVVLAELFLVGKAKWTMIG